MVTIIDLRFHTKNVLNIYYGYCERLMKDFVTQSASIRQALNHVKNSQFLCTFRFEFLMHELYDFSCYPTESYIQILNEMVYRMFHSKQGVKRIDEDRRNVKKQTRTITINHLFPHDRVH